MKYYGVGNFNKDIEKMIDELVSIVEENLAIQEYIDEVGDHLCEDDIFSAVVSYIAYHYDVA